MFKCKESYLTFVNTVFVNIVLILKKKIDIKK